jgi:hypothetical protein
VYRITHTWQKDPDGWHIIGGLSCAVPRSNDSASLVSSARAKSADVSTIERIITASYEAVSGPVGAPRQWDRYRNLVDFQGRLVAISVDDKTSQPRITRWGRDEYFHAANDYLVKTGFTDRKLRCTTNQFGNVATVRCGVEGLEGAKIVSAAWPCTSSTMMASDGGSRR